MENIETPRAKFWQEMKVKVSDMQVNDIVIVPGIGGESRGFYQMVQYSFGGSGINIHFNNGTKLYSRGGKDEYNILRPV